MPPTRPLATQCRYGLQCTRADCYYTHPKGRDMKQTCSFGRSCFRKVCHLSHPEGRLMDQLRPNIDYCAACTLVRPKELPKVSAAFEAAFPAANDGNDRCDFVAAVPMGVAFRDWKNLRGISTTGTPDGVPSTPEKIRLFPRTRNGERLLQDARVRQGMRWSPTPYRPWKTLERMASHDQHWDENQDMYVLCAGYEDTSRDGGVCIELSVTGTVKSEDDGDAVKAGTRVAREILGLPGANSQTWFVFHVSRPEENEGEAQFVTVKAIVDPAKLPTVKSSKPTIGKSPTGFAAAAGTIAPPPPPPASATFTFPPRPPPATPPSKTRPAQPQETPPSVGRIPTPSPIPMPIGVGSGSLGPVMAPAPGGAGLLAPGAPTSGGPWPTAIGSPMDAKIPVLNRFSSSRGLTASRGRTASAVGYASSSDPASTDSELGSTLSFGAYVDEATAVLAAAPPLSAPSCSRFFGAQDTGAWVGVVGERGVQKSSSFVLEGVEKAPPAMVMPMTVAAVEEDELSQLLERLNMSKYRSKFASKQVDYNTLKMMTEEEQLSDIGIPLGPRIKLMNELGIERPNT